MRHRQVRRVALPSPGDPAARRYRIVVRIQRPQLASARCGARAGGISTPRQSCAPSQPAAQRLHAAFGRRGAVHAAAAANRSRRPVSARAAVQLDAVAAHLRHRAVGPHLADQAAKRAPWCRRWLALLEQQHVPVARSFAGGRPSGQPTMPPPTMTMQTHLVGESSEWPLPTARWWRWCGLCVSRCPARAQRTATRSRVARGKTDLYRSPDERVWAAPNAADRAGPDQPISGTPGRLDAKRVRACAPQHNSSSPNRPGRDPACRLPAASVSQPVEPHAAATRTDGPCPG